MEPIKAVIEEASIRKISDIFPKKPPGLRFNETDALIVIAKTAKGMTASSTFYFSMKSDGTFDENALGSTVAQARRHRLASFLRYYGISENIEDFKFRESIGELRGRSVEVVYSNGEATIYVP